MDLDRHRLYELCVQSPGHVAAFLRGVHGRTPRRLDEDFCGSASVSRAWVSGDEHTVAVATDMDGATLEAARVLAGEQGVDLARLELVERDCLAIAAAERADAHGGADVIFVGNFSIGYIHARTALVAYLRSCHARLAVRRGVLVCDLYGGANAFVPGGGTRQFPWPDGQTAHYTWRNETADVLTSMVSNTISFRLAIGVGEKPEITAEWPDAFAYRWRLWGLAELREAMAEAGFGRSEVYLDYRLGPEGRPRPVARPEAMPGDWVVLIAARV